MSSKQNKTSVLQPYCLSICAPTGRWASCRTQTDTCTVSAAGSPSQSLLPARCRPEHSYTVKIYRKALFQTGHFMYFQVHLIEGNVSLKDWKDFVWFCMLPCVWVSSHKPKTCIFSSAGGSKRPLGVRVRLNSMVPNVAHLAHLTQIFKLLHTIVQMCINKRKSKC